MLNQIKGLHHVTSLTSNARANNKFFTKTLGLRRVKKTVNFDSPDTYHLYYGNEIGAPGTIMTYFPFADMGPRLEGTSEVSTTAFTIPEGSIEYWINRLTPHGSAPLKAHEVFGEKRLQFSGADGEGLAVVEVKDDRRPQWLDGGVGSTHAIRGFHSVSLRVKDAAPMMELLTFMGYQPMQAEGGTTRLALETGNGAHHIDLDVQPGMSLAFQGAGSVHHVAFAVEDRTKQLEVRDALLDAGYRVTPVIDRDYFWAIYFPTPGGILFEIATGEPGFARDEDIGSLGQDLKLPEQYTRYRAEIENVLEPLDD